VSLMAACAPTMKRVSLELGGNAPFIVFDDADVDAVRGTLSPTLSSRTRCSDLSLAVPLSRSRLPSERLLVCRCRCVHRHIADSLCAGRDRSHRREVPQQRPDVRVCQSVGSARLHSLSAHARVLLTRVVVCMSCHSIFVQVKAQHASRI
jgi:hypothetical protein